MEEFTTCGKAAGDARLFPLLQYSVFQCLLTLHRESEIDVQNRHADMY